MLVFDPTVFPQVEALRKIHCITLKTSKNLNSLNFPPPASSSALASNVGILPLNLPFPNDILAPVMSFNVSESMRTELLRCFTGRVAELQHKCETSYQNACASSPCLTHSSRNQKLREAYQQLYRRQCHALVESQFPYILEEVAKHRRLAASHEKKIIFNHEYTPVLENYFEHNAYPTLPDRLLLARKSMMTPRQIEVWFQNHRNRAKKEGIPLKRLTFNVSSTFSFDKLQAKTPYLIIPKGDISTTLDTDPSDDEEGMNESINISHTSPISAVIHSERPPHAFPQPYRSNSAYDPLPADNGTFKFPSPSWLRRPATSAPQYPPVDIDNLAILFASKMDLRSASSKTLRTSTTPFISQSHSGKWFSPTVTVPCPAPHPASIRTSRIPTLSPASTFTSQEPYSWQRPSLPCRKTTTLRLHSSFPSWRIPDDARSRKKTPNIPKRTPSTVPACMAEFQPSQSSCSRASSLSSISSTESRSTSMSSNSSLTSNASSPKPTTPSPAFAERRSSLSESLDFNTRRDPYSTFGDFSLLDPDHFDKTTQTKNLSLTLSDFPSMCLPIFPFFEP